jgi:hypothetical protein
MSKRVIWGICAIVALEGIPWICAVVMRLL